MRVSPKLVPTQRVPFLSRLMFQTHVCGQALVHLPGFPNASAKPPRHTAASQTDPHRPFAILQHRCRVFVAQTALADLRCSTPSLVWIASP